MLTLRDRHSGAVYAIRLARCECCLARHDPSSRSTRLVLDHTWHPDGSYFLTLLCFICNSQKGDLPYVSRGADRCWWPGMPPRTVMAKPPAGERNKLATSFIAGHVRIGR